MSPEQAALGWIAGYTAHLRAAAGRFEEVGLDADYLSRCQEFDAALRALDADGLRAAVSAPAGAALYAELQAAQAAFERASAEVKDTLEARRNAVRAGRSTLRAYAETGALGGPDARYLTRRG